MVSGLRMRRAFQLYDGTAKTDPKDAWVLADYARRNLDRLHVVQAIDQQIQWLSVIIFAMWVMHSWWKLVRARAVNAATVVPFSSDSVSE